MKNCCHFFATIALTVTGMANSSCSVPQGCAYKFVTATAYSVQSVARAKEKVGSEKLSYFDTDPHPVDTAGATPILLIHGVTADKESWLFMMGKLRKRHRLIGIDLAGHGKSSEATDNDYSFARQAERIRQLMEQLHIERAHLVGHSMGGGIAMKFAVLYPDKTVSLGLIDPAGASGQETEEFSQLEQSHANPLLVTRTWSASDKYEYVTNGPKLFHLGSRLFLGAYLDRRDRKRDSRNRRIYATVSRETLSRVELASIDQPVFILWGAGDRVLRREMADYYRNHIPGAVNNPVMLDSGHCPNIEHGGETADAYLEFLKGLGEIPRSQ